MTRAALVIGAASGMGRAVALRLAASGYAVAAADRDATALEAVGAELRATGARHVLLAVDLADRTSIDQGVAAAREALGPLWLLAVTAGVLEGGMALDADPEHHERVLRINYLGVVHANAVAARTMVADGAGGRIVNWSSNNAVGGSAGFSAYAASKAALDAFSQSLALELGPHGITVNTILPGSVRTPMLGALSDDEVAAEEQRIPIGRFGEPDDVAAALLFLAGPEAGWITGVNLPIDGGTLAANGRPGAAAVGARLVRERQRTDAA